MIWMNNAVKRIEALMMVMTLCLLVYNVTQYRLREALKTQQETLPNQLNKPIQNPTLRWIFQLMEGISIVTLSDTMGPDQKFVTNLNEVRQKVILLFGKTAGSKRKFQGYTVCNRKRHVRLKISPEAIKHFKGDVKAAIRRGRGCALSKTIAVLNRKLQGWLNYFQHIGVKGILQELDGWLRRYLRKVLWRQWKRPRTRVKRLMRLGLDVKRAQKSACNGRGAWWNAGASHMNQALPKQWFDRMNLVSLVDYQCRLKCFT
uniref:Group II intron reverse transcriptase/maturase n=1 Tax=uncultured Thiotrichaceae bacterium TaxID=298394 RepID=A0A6S6U6Q2_9GAMM|nr:MAG: Group II intron reverse transcriptase/maturase [uncultured Thiotrichaceae bacterium]